MEASINSSKTTTIDIMGLDLRTPIEKERDAFHSKVCQMYVELSTKFPKASPNRIFSTIAAQVNRSVPNVRDIIIKHGLYATK
jgi:thymidylate kinase